MKTTIKQLYVLLFVLLTNAVSAGELIITKSFTGSWYDPTKNGQGFILEIIKSNNQKKALVTWFTFDVAGNQYWLLGVGTIENQSIHFNMILPEGGRFGNDHDPNNVTSIDWGELTFTFSDCNSGVASWNSNIMGFNSGSMTVIRNTAINNLNCTGGLFDDLGDTLTESETITPLLSTGIVSGANGKSKYEQRTDRIEYSVEVEDVPVGAYQLFVAGIEQGEINVSMQSDGSTKGEIEFRDPVEPGKLPLTFDPVGKVVDIVQDGSVFLTSDGLPVDNGNTGTSPDAPPFGNSETEVYLVNTGVAPFGEAKAKLRQRSDRVDFQVEMEDVPVGFYDFKVDGETHGVIEVVETLAGIEGELEFRNPVEAGKELLDFNPLGQTLTLSQSETVFFTIDFPSEPGNGDDSDDDSGDDSGDDNGDDSGDDNGDDSGDDNGDDSGDDSDDGGDDSIDTQDIEVDFENTGVDTNASGKVKYEVRNDRRDFKVEAEDLDFGTYELFVGGNSVAIFEVSSSETELEFRDPVEPGKLPLDFDPLNQLIEIKMSDVVYLSATLQ